MMTNPAMLDSRLAGRTGRFGDAIAVLQVQVNFAPGEAKTVVFTLGAAEDGKEDAGEFIRRYTSVEKSERAFQEAKAFWARFVESEQVETPDEAFNFMTNTWLKYQSISCRLWGKSAFYQVSAGYGYRGSVARQPDFPDQRTGIRKKAVATARGEPVHRRGCVPLVVHDLKCWGPADQLLRRFVVVAIYPGCRT